MEPFPFVGGYEIQMRLSEKSQSISKIKWLNNSHFYFNDKHCLIKPNEI